MKSQDTPSMTGVSNATAERSSTDACDATATFLEWMSSFDRFDGRKGIKPGLERMEAMLEHLGNPHLDMKFLHVAGTNGKGSTCAYLTSILEAAGYRVGLFTSPYLTSFHDRMSVGGMNITDEELSALAALLRPAVEVVSETVHGRPTEFEVVTLLSLLHYSRAGVDIVVWETGLGGRLDSTNVVTPVLSLITNVGLDHQAILGESIEQIATEKAGIIKPGVPVLTTATEPALDVILRTASEKSAPAFVWGRDFSAERSDLLGLEGQTFGWQERVGHGQSRGDTLIEATTLGTASNQVANVVAGTGHVAFSKLQIGMLGPHQVLNASLAVAACVQLNRMGWTISEEALRQGLANTRWAGRFEVIERDPLLILDGAHNPEGAAVLAKTVAELLPNTKLTVVVGILADKAIPGVLAPVLCYATHVIVTRADFPRAAVPADVARVVRELDPQVPCEVYDTVQQALDRARELTRRGETDAILVTGSLYMISEARSLLL
ncbi:bifunctional folylpolyglutamate synthase/dihydrofolate synthase [Tumebacillus permanentifrigoris]|uniref:tetrahydrofolate synthase n=1 Tax=Tumebacillus permanentifrigoris TaxID=378543 RepID=A0A316D5Y6_9BACL|nr:folylpolyglutamate synthase/dihydrofolate synthase family protein [Tumebacillus permanentifrigoris]PWK06246.1 dihydrofolate synthase/folylpolyglutamate synthase [Tumebacillus permanentifrigoris]